MFADVVSFRPLIQVRSVNNRRLWVLKEFQAELKKTSDPVEVAVILHPLCKGTAKFIMEFCEDLMTAESMEVRSHPDVTVQLIKQFLHDFNVFFIVFKSKPLRHTSPLNKCRDRKVDFRVCVINFDL